MKKILTILAVLIATATVATAQIGARIGMDFASFRGDWKDDYKSNVGLHLGVVYNIELADVLSLQPGAFYVQRNWKTDNEFDIKIHSHHIEVPIVLKYNLDVTSDIKIDPHVGPYFGFGFAGKSKDEVPLWNKKMRVFKDKEEWDMGVANFDMGIQMGVGATFYDAAYVGFDFELGFHEFNSPINKANKAHNNMFMITFGVWLPE